MVLRFFTVLVLFSVGWRAAEAGPFDKFENCQECTGAGFGWCPKARKCGGFANRECGEGERYVSEGMPASRAKPSRNGVPHSLASLTRSPIGPAAHL